jgi:ribosomal protein S18 acetylase RimI-like enzyme
MEIAGRLCYKRNVTLRIVPATVEDAPLVHQIMREAFAEYLGVLQPPSGAHSETVSDVEQAIRRAGAVLVWDGPIAVASARFALGPDHLYVGRVAVLPLFRRRGIASAIMAWMEELARRSSRDRVQVAVRKSLPHNVALYQGLGYVTVDVHPHPKGFDEVVTLVKELR